MTVSTREFTGWPSEGGNAARGFCEASASIASGSSGLPLSDWVWECSLWLSGWLWSDRVQTSEPILWRRNDHQYPASAR